MKRLGLAVAILAFVLAVPVGVMYLAVPPNENPEDGPADPIRGLRRPILAALRAVGLADPPRLWFSGSEVYEEGPNGERIVLWRMEIDREPVYRALFFRVGHRVRYRTTEFDDERNHWQVLRICYTEDGKKIVAGEGTLENGMLDPEGRDHTVRGYVPCSADGYWVEAADQKGDVHCQHSWGDIKDFWRD